MEYRNYQDPQYKKWRKDIYSRDNYACQWPGCKNKQKLNAHHIHKWSEHPGLRFHINNGITLCKTHHELINGMEDYYIQFFSTIIKNKGNNHEIK
jgi:5-methylcytosine-specific restriction endonuclease McrA